MADILGNEDIDKMKRLFLIVLIICSVAATGVFFFGCDKGSQDYPVGVARATVSTKIDLTNKLNPAILPDVMKEVLREAAPQEKPESKKFQQKIVQSLSQKIMDDPEVNYQVDLNEDGNRDPLLVGPESVQQQSAIYSLRVPDPSQHTIDPDQNANWHQIAKDGIELVAVSLTYEQNSSSMTINAESNQHVYEGRALHHKSSYYANEHSWMTSYFRYMIIRDILFRPYGWYGPGWYGGWYGSYYGGWHAPVRTRTVTRTTTRYRRAMPSKTAGNNISRSSKAKNRTQQAPKSIQNMKSKRVMASRQAKSTSRSGGFGRSTTSSRSSRSSSSKGLNRSRSASSFRGGSRGFGK